MGNCGNTANFIHDRIKSTWAGFGDKFLDKTLKGQKEGNLSEIWTLINNCVLMLVH